jgi:hypothetical protein
MAQGPSMLPRFDLWRQDFGGAPTLWDYASQKGGMTLAIAFASLFWPKLIEVDGCVLLAERYDPETFRQWRDKLGDKREAIERTVNHIHLWDLFDPESDEVPDEQVRVLATTIAHTWRCALNQQFPGRNGDVALAWDEPDYGPTLTLFTRSLDSMPQRTAETPRS